VRLRTAQVAACYDLRNLPGVDALEVELGEERRELLLCALKLRPLQKAVEYAARARTRPLEGRWSK
jgi:hypothetical protein